MEIILKDIGKKYMHKWIFRNLNLLFADSQQIGILGNNGSGKTTFIRLVSGLISPSEGQIVWKIDQKDAKSDLYKYIGIASPHLELFEEFTLTESLLFHQKFKPFVDHLNIKTIIEYSGLTKSKDKALKYFSSGMKQRVKLLLAVLSDVPLILLDEPCSNLDEASEKWYQNLLNDFLQDRLLLVASNNKQVECFSCKRFIEF